MEEIKTQEAIDMLTETGIIINNAGMHRASNTGSSQQWTTVTSSGTGTVYLGGSDITFHSPEELRIKDQIDNYHKKTEELLTGTNERLGKLKRLLKERNNLKEKVTELEAEVAYLTQDIYALETKNSELEKRIETLEQTLNVQVFSLQESIRNLELKSK